jgi:hypothetical protein
MLFYICSKKFKKKNYFTGAALAPCELKSMLFLHSPAITCNNYNLGYLKMLEVSNNKLFFKKIKYFKSPV